MSEPVGAYGVSGAVVRAWAFYSLALAVNAVTCFLWSQALYLQHRALTVRHVTRGAPPPPPWLSLGAVNTVGLVSLLSALAALVLALFVSSCGESHFGTVVLLMEILLFLAVLFLFPVF